MGQRGNGSRGRVAHLSARARPSVLPVGGGGSGGGGARRGSGRCRRRGRRICLLEDGRLRPVGRGGLPGRFVWGLPLRGGGLWGLGRLLEGGGEGGRGDDGGEGGAEQEDRGEHDRQHVEEAAGDAGVAQAEVDGERAHGQADGEHPQRDVVHGAPFLVG